MHRVGFVINSRFPEWRAMSRGMRPQHLLTGWPDRASPMHFMRFGWIAGEINRTHSEDLHYELFRPWRRYDAVVFLKSMAAGCLDHARRLKRQGAAVIFEANVDYYSKSEVTLPAGHLQPTSEQREQAVSMTAEASGVIASSSHLASICREWNTRTFHVPDHIPRNLLPSLAGRAPFSGHPLPVWWSGMADKAADLLAAGEALRSMGNRIRLHLVTGNLSSALSRLDPASAEGVRSLLASVPHTIHPFRSIRDLLRLYASGGGVIISPRFLENPYNKSHTEWKITLGMACGLPAIASPQSSYLEVRDHAEDPSAVTICNRSKEWEEALEAALDCRRHATASSAARKAVETHYVTEVVAPRHARAVKSILENQ